MSQRCFTTPRYAVLTGWDRPLQYLFLVITARDTGAIVYSNLDDPHGPGLSLPGIRQRLAHFEITPPPSLWDDLAADRRANVGNLSVAYDAPAPEAAHAATSEARTASTRGAGEAGDPSARGAPHAQDPPVRAPT